MAEGGWYWYAVLMRGGHRLYAEMHLPLQPLYVLMTAWSLELFGRGWLASQTLAIAQLIIFLVALQLIVRRILWNDWQKAILFVAAFGLALDTSFFRFDDYHIIELCFEFYAVSLLLWLADQTSQVHHFLAAILLGVICGLSVSNRLNDGAFLLAAVGFTLPLLVKQNKVLLSAIFFISALASVVSVVLITGDSLQDWFTNSVIRAAAVKGGTQHILFGPLMLPITILRGLVASGRIVLNILYELAFIAVCSWMARPGHSSDGRPSKGRIALGTTLIVLSMPLFYRQAVVGRPSIAFSAVAALALLIVTIAVLVRLFRTLFGGRLKDWYPQELLLLVPFAQMVDITTSSGTSYLWPNEPAALLLLLLPISFPSRFHKSTQRLLYAALAMLVGFSVFISKVTTPFHWQNYTVRSMFAGREWYRDSVHGPMYIETDQLNLMRTICGGIGPHSQLLSIPYPYPNYFCATPPWHGYVQTWYDTSSKLTIDKLIAELASAPPEWIVYQRSLERLEVHEKAYNDGRPLPHRALDALIMDRIVHGNWTVIHREYLQEADRILIHTR
jgi:hypothetical protein